MGIELEVAGRHALLFDDDSAAAFVNSGDALVDWNSLLIDRYDVRHLLSAPPPPRKRRHHSPPDGSSDETELNRERYLDLQAAIEKEELDVDAKSVELGGFHSVAFSYGNTVDSNDQKNYNDGMGDSGFRPPFPVPESLLQCLPPTEKVHQIMARTALFVSKNGGQSEIVLRVKQGDNPTFGFLMPDHHLHPYFRYLVDHQDLLKCDMVGKSENEEHSKNTSGALSLLGSVYGSGDDEEAASDNGPESKLNESSETVPAGVSSSVGPNSQKTEIVAKANERDETALKHASSKDENIPVLKKNSLMKVSKAGIPNSKKKEPESALPSATVNKPSCSASVNASTIEKVIVEPPSDVRKLVDKVVEFILKNGPQFEAVLTEQDSKQGRFPFLLPSNQFNSYYVNVLRKAQELKLSGKRFLSEKDDQMLSRLEKKSSVDKESASLSVGPAGGDIPYDCDRKEKFKMVLGKPKKDVDEPASRTDAPPYGNTIDAAQTAAILQAATRGVKNTHFVPNISLNGDIQKGAEDEAQMTKEQKLKAERLKRAKMFVSMLKSGAAPSKFETPRSLSMEPHPPLVSGKEGSVALGVETSVRKNGLERKLSDSEIQERLSRRKYRSRPSRNEDDEERDKFEDGGEQGKDEKHIRKKHKSRRSSCESDNDIEEDEVNEDYRHTKRKHRSHRSSSEKGLEEVDDDDDEEDGDHRHGQRKHRSRHYSRDMEEEQEDDEKDRDHRHGQRKHRSRHYSRDIEEQEDDEKDRDHGHGKRKHRTHRSSREHDREEDEEDRNYRHGKRKHRSHRSSRNDEIEEDDDCRDYKKGRKKHRSHHSTDEDDEEDYEERHTKKKHRSRHSSRKDKHKHRQRYSSTKNESSDDENYSDSSSERGKNISQSAEDLEEGEIISKISDRSRGRAAGDVSREASIDVARSHRAPSQPLESSEVPEDLRAKIRAMLMANS